MNNIYISNVPYGANTLLCSYLFFYYTEYFLRYVMAKMNFRSSITVIFLFICYIITYKENFKWQNNKLKYKVATGRRRVKNQIKLYSR